VTAYAELETRFRRLGNLAGASAMLQWDWAAMMPSGGADVRADQLAELDLLCHEMVTDAALGALLDEAESGGGDLGTWQRANLAEMRRRWRHATAVPADLVKAMSETTARCEMVWREARPKSNFAAFAKAFEPLLGLVREKAAALADALDSAPYDALIDTHDPGLRCAIIDPLFDDLADFLPDFLAEVQEKQKRDGALPKPPGSIPQADQQALAKRLMTALGFDFEHGRLDISHHPFCGGVSGDIRITTRYDEADFSSGLMGVLHETGHALYEAGLPEEWRLQPVGSARGMALHESQSLLIEMQACRSLPFITFLVPILRDYLDDPSSVAADALYRRAIHVEPGYIRVDSDEVTYPAHIMLRYKLEKALISGDLAVADIPGAWNDELEALLGLRPRNDAEGCLQDIHWSVGELGYFPSYTLGALMAAQFFDAATRAEPDVWSGIEQGDFTPLLGWLRANVHSLASRHTGPEILEQATGKPLGTEVFKAHLQRRYLNRT
jgi:carboxypeptidase Taq